MTDLLRDFLVNAKIMKEMLFENFIDVECGPKFCHQLQWHYPFFGQFISKDLTSIHLF